MLTAFDQLVASDAQLQPSQLNTLMACAHISSGEVSLCSQVEEYGFQRNYPFLFNVVIGSCCLCVELACLGEFIRRIIKALLEHKRW